MIPALVDAHSHIGYMKNLTSGPQNYTRENILDHMHRFAYFGVAASQAMGTDFGELPFQLRDEILAGKHPDAARFLTAGRGLAPLDEDQPGQHAARGVSRHDRARTRARGAGTGGAQGARSSRPGSTTAAARIKKLTPELYGAIIDEAHKHNMRVAVHATGSPTPRICCAPASTSSRT